MSYLIFDFVCLADTHGIAKYARTYTQRDTHTRAQKKKPNKRKKQEDVCVYWSIHGVWSLTLQ